MSDITTTTYDVAVIGAGPGGYVAAIRCAQLGLSTVCIERDALGGICLNWGCIPSKALLSSASLYRKMSKPQAWGFKIEGLEVDWPAVIKRSRKVAGRLNKGVGGLFRKYGVTHVAGEARFDTPKRLVVKPTDGGEAHAIEAAHIIVATGASARPMPGLPFDGERVLSYKEAMVAPEQPKRLLVIGAGAIGCEFAYFFNSFGTEVTVAELAPRIVPVEDAEVSASLEASFKRQGIKVHTGTLATGFEVTDSGVNATLQPAGDPDAEGTSIEVDQVLVAIGVVPNLGGLGLEEVGVTLERGRVRVDADMGTSTEGIYALGDITPGPALAHKASFEGVHCAERIAGHAGKPLDYGNIPGCTYCEPQIASVGLTEEAAREAGYELKIGRFPFTASGKALATGDSEGFTKVIFDAATGELLGCHMIGHGVTDLVSEVALARTMEATEHELLATVHPHPTLSEALHEAIAQAFGEGVNF